MQRRKTEPAPDPFTSGAIRDVVVRDLRKYVDERGWLTELFRHDELTAEFYPQMAYISATQPHLTRGPHEHVDQSDLFLLYRAGQFQAAHVG
jgi:dTDP-4-dehydrorhamnose 3,5-epimerase